MLKEQIRECFKEAMSDRPLMPHILKSLIGRQLRLAVDTVAVLLYDVPTIYDSRMSSPGRALYNQQCKVLLGDTARNKLVVFHGLLSRFLAEFETMTLEEWEEKKMKTLEEGKGETRNEKENKR